MPGTPPTSPRFAIPRYSDSDEISFSAQINAVTDTFDADAAKLGADAAFADLSATGVIDPAAVTALPATPDDGEVIDFLADATDGVIWQLKYRAASTSGYKWEHRGGSDLYIAQTGAAAVSSGGGYQDLTSGPLAITLPLGGDFDVSWGFAAIDNFNEAAAAIIAGISVNGAAPGLTVARYGFTFANAPGGTPFQEASPQMSARVTGRAAGQVLSVRYSVSGNIDVANPWLRIKPVRVG